MSKSLVEGFYSKVLTAGGSDNIVADAEKILAPEWSSIGNYAGPHKDRAAFVKQMTGFLQLIPDLVWKIEEVVASDDRYIVRSRASGTPKGPFFGIEPTGKKFEMMTIDMHTVKNGKIVATHHVEDWAGAMAQLR